MQSEESGKTSKIIARNLTYTQMYRGAIERFSLGNDMTQQVVKALL